MAKYEVGQQVWVRDTYAADLIEGIVEKVARKIVTVKVGVRSRRFYMDTRHEVGEFERGVLTSPEIEAEQAEIDALRRSLLGRGIAIHRGHVSTQHLRLADYQAIEAILDAAEARP